MYVDILSGDRMIVGMSISVRLATGFGGLTPSHSLAPVTIPRLGRDNFKLFRILILIYVVLYCAIFF